MSRIVVTDHISLDGVMQSPAAPEEDTREGFEHGGWAAPYGDEVMGAVMAEGMAKPGSLLLGRRTYEHFAAFWPHQTEPNPYTDVLNRTQKYVASRTLEEPLPWENSTLLEGDVPEAVARLKEEQEHDLVDPRQRRADPVADEARPDRRVPAHDPSAGARPGPPAVR